MNRYATSAIGLCLAAGVCGCSTTIIQSNTASAGMSGLVYALPVGQVQIVASRKKVDSEDVKTAKADAEKKKAVADTDQKRLDEAKAELAELNGAMPGADEPGGAYLAGKLAEAKRRAANLEVIAQKSKRVASEALANAESVAGMIGKLQETVAITQLANAPGANRYVANLNHLVTRNDKISLSVSNGLLTTAGLTSTDDTGAILVSVGQAIGAFGGRSSGNQVLSFAPAEEVEKACETYAYAAIFDPLDGDDVRQVQKEFAKRSGLLELAVLNDQGLTPPKANTPDAPKYGLIYRTAAQVRIGLEPAAVATCQVGASYKRPDPKWTVFIVPDTGQWYAADGKGGAFVTTELDYGFKEGMLTSFKQTKPSELAAVVGIPVAMVKAVLAAPAEILQLKVNYDNTAAARAKAEADLAANQLEAIKNQNDLAAARDAADASASNETSP